MSEALAKTSWWREGRTLLILGRVSNLPTVWSNCLAGWLLGGGGSAGRFGLLCLGASCLYVSGMFLNDAFDADFDRQHRQARPVPSGAISLGKVWGWGFGWMAAGILFLTLLGSKAMVLALVLSGCILLYDAIHKAIIVSPLLMAGCRFLLYLLAASAAVDGIAGLAIWSGLALAGYVAGLSFIARKESGRQPAVYWPVLGLAAPMLLAWVVNTGVYRYQAAALTLVLGIWIIYCLRQTFWTPTANVGLTVSGLLAGICLVDWLALAGGSPLISGAFVLLFLSALFAQRFIPAT